MNEPVAVKGEMDQPPASDESETMGTTGRPRRLGLHHVLQPLVFALVVGLWYGATKTLGIPQYILPGPVAVGGQLLHDLTSASFYANVQVTLTEILAGFGAAAIGAIILGSLVAAIPLLENVLTPYIVAFQTMPKVALAPLAIIWLGYGISSKIVLSALIAFFPAFVNIVAGFKSIDPDQILLMKSLGASRSQTFIKVRLPAILPFLMAGLDIAIVFAVIGAVVVEFIGSAMGLGSLILQRQANVDVAGVLSVLVVLSFIGVALHLILLLVSHRFTSWADQREFAAP
jgi:NitT/TauT family transport system permease protein